MALAATNPDKSQSHLADYYLCHLMDIPLLSDRLKVIDALQSADSELEEQVTNVRLPLPACLLACLLACWLAPFLTYLG